MHTSIFAIGLFGDRLEVALWRRGCMAASRRRPAALDGKTAEQWPDAVRELAPDVREMVGEIVAETNAHARRAFVIYASPSAVGDFMSFPVRTAGQARSAASLAVMDSMPGAAETVVCETLFIERDEPPARSMRSAVGQAAATSKTDGRAQRAHVVAAADCETVLIAMQAMVERAGLRFRGAVPVQASIAACAMARAVDRDSALAAVDQKPGGEVAVASTTAPTAHLHVAEAGSFLLIRDGQTDANGSGNLRFTRSIPIGVSALAASLMRRRGAGESQHEDADDEQPIVHVECLLDAATAQQALFEFGLPATPSAVHEPTGLTARDVLPLLQPLVQRMTVELRQSLRFALESAERSRVTFIVSGAGAVVPGLAAALGRELNVPAFIQKSGEGAADGEPGGGLGEGLGGGPRGAQPAATDLEAALSAWVIPAFNSISDLALQPRELALRTSSTRIRRGLWAGAAAALLLILLDAGRLASHIAHASLGADGSSATVHPAAERSPLLARVAEDPEGTFALIESARQFRAIVDRETSRRIDFRACMHELSRITPRSVRFTNVNFQPGGGGGGERAGATIAGVARPSADAPARAELERFVHDLRESPLFDEVALANVHVESEESLEQRFELRFVAPPAPAHARRQSSDRDRLAVPGVADASQGGAE